MRMYMVTLERRVALATGHGDKRTFNPGDVLLVEGVTGKGHTTRAIGEWVRITVAIPPNP